MVTWRGHRWEGHFSFVQSVEGWARPCKLATPLPAVRRVPPQGNQCGSGERSRWPWSFLESSLGDLSRRGVNPSCPPRHPVHPHTSVLPSLISPACVSTNHPNGLWIYLLSSLFGAVCALRPEGRAQEGDSDLFTHSHSLEPVCSFARGSTWGQHGWVSWAGPICLWSHLFCPEGNGSRPRVPSGWKPHLGHTPGHALGLLAEACVRTCRGARRHRSHGPLWLPSFFFFF